MNGTPEAPGPASGSGGVAHPGYEFTEEQNTRLARLAGRMTVVATVLLVIAVLALVGGIVQEDAAERVGTIVQAVILGLIGWWTRRAAQAFRAVTTTEGRDIPHLMDAVRELYRLYNLQFWVLLVALGLIVVGIVVGIVTAATGAH